MSDMKMLYDAPLDTVISDYHVYEIDGDRNVQLTARHVKKLEIANTQYGRLFTALVKMVIEHRADTWRMLTNAKLVTGDDPSKVAKLGQAFGQEPIVNDDKAHDEDETVWNAFRKFGSHNITKSAFDLQMLTDDELKRLYDAQPTNLGMHLLSNDEHFAWKMVIGEFERRKELIDRQRQETRECYNAQYNAQTHAFRK